MPKIAGFIIFIVSKKLGSFFCVCCFASFLALATPVTVENILKAKGKLPFPIGVTLLRVPSHHPVPLAFLPPNGPFAILASVAFTFSTLVALGTGTFFNPED